MNIFSKLRHALLGRPQPSASAQQNAVASGSGSNDAGERRIDLLAPQALVCTFDAECSNPYGCALLARAYPAWFEKWMPGGAKRTLRLRMIKDAYIGDSN